MKDESLRTSDLAALISALGMDRVVGRDGGAYVRPAKRARVVRFTGLLLDGRVAQIYEIAAGRWHKVVRVEEPSGTTPGVLHLGDAILTADAALVIPFAGSSLGFNSAVDAYQTYCMNPEFGHINGPVLLVKQAAQQPDSDDAIQPCVTYPRLTIQADWECANADQKWQVDIEARLDDEKTRTVRARA